MGASHRLTSLESALEGKERVLAWLKKTQALGGFFDYCKAANPPIVIEDEESAFLFCLVNRCNGEVLEITSCPIKYLFALYLLHVLRSAEPEANEGELQNFRMLFLNFLVDGLALEGAIQQVCKDHFAGSPLLFSDLQQQLTERNQAGKQLLGSYNLYALNWGFKPIADDELHSAISKGTLLKADVLVRLSRAEAAAKFSGVFEARELLRPLMAG